MVLRPDNVRRVAATREGARRFSWVEWALAFTFAALVFQLFPSLWWAVISVVDVRNWTWRSYAAVSTIAIVVLFVAKAWQDNAWQNR
jgi:hypothetical protein